MAVDNLLDPQHLIALARQQTGLHDFDELPVDEPLRRLTTALNTEANLNAMGRETWHHRILNALITRLRAQDWFTRKPEILEEKIVAPLVILGLTRTGTTLLQRLIASDTRFYSAAWWENRFPVPAQDDVKGDQRIAMAKAEVAAILKASPELAAIHPWDALGADEDILLIDQTLMSTASGTMACIPSYHAWIQDLDLKPAYSYLEKMLKFLQWQKRQRGVTAERWLLKTPMHLGHIDAIVELFPDAQFIQTHREPTQTLPSYASMIYNLWLGVSDSSDAIEAGRSTSATMHHDLYRCMEERDKLPADRFYDVDFRETVSDPLGLLERIYKHFGIPMTDLARQQMQAYMASNPREKRPAHNYTLEQFGFTEAGVKERFQKYRKRHLDPNA
jgi:hypothetical protein